MGRKKVQRKCNMSYIIFQFIFVCLYSYIYKFSQLSPKPWWKILTAFDRKTEAERDCSSFLVLKVEKLSTEEEPFTLSMRTRRRTSVGIRSTPRPTTTAMGIAPRVASSAAKEREDSSSEDKWRCIRRWVVTVELWFHVAAIFVCIWIAFQAEYFVMMYWKFIYYSFIMIRYSVYFMHWLCKQRTCLCSV